MLSTMITSGSSSGTLHATPQASRKIREGQLDIIQDQIKEAFTRKQFEETESTQEEDLVNIFQHVKPSTPWSSLSCLEGEAEKSETYAAAIVHLKKELASKYSDLEDPEIGLILIESLLKKDLLRRSMSVIGIVWARVFCKPTPNWDKEIGLTALFAFSHLVRKSNVGVVHDFSHIIQFLKAAENSISLEGFEEWITRCVEEIARLPKELYIAFCKTLSKDSESGQPGSLIFTLRYLLVEQDAKAKLCKGKVEADHDALEKTIDCLDTVSLSSLGVWSKTLEKVTSCKFVDLKKKAWMLWSGECRTSTDKTHFVKAWNHAAGLLRYVDPGDASAFFCQDRFSTILDAFASQPENLQSFYDIAIKHALKDGTNVSAVIKNHLNYISSHPILRGYSIFGPIMQAINIPQGILNCIQLLNGYVINNFADKQTVKAIHEWLLFRVKTPLPEESVLPLIELAEAVLKSWDNKAAASINCCEIAKRIKDIKVKGSRGIALRYAFKEVISLDQDKHVSDKAKYQRLDQAFDLMSSLIPQLDDQEFLALIKHPDMKTVSDICGNNITTKAWQASRGGHFCEKVIERCSRVQMNRAECMPVICDIWNLVKDIPGVSKEVSTKMIKMALSTEGNDASIEKWIDALKDNCTQYLDIFNQGVHIRNTGGSITTVCGPVEDLIFQLCEEGKAAKERKHGFYAVALKLVCEDEAQFGRFVSNGTAKKLVRLCFDNMATYTTASLPDGISHYVDALFELALDSKMKSEFTKYLKETKDQEKFLNELHSLLFVSLKGAEVPLGKETLDESDEVNIAVSFDITADYLDYMFESDGLTRDFKKKVWLSALQFALKHWEKMPVKVWIEYLILLGELISTLIQYEVTTLDNKSTISLDVLTDIVKVYEDVQDTLHSLYDTIPYGCKKLTLFAFLHRIARHLISFRETSIEAKQKVFLSLFRKAYELEVVDEELDGILQLGVEAQFSDSYKTIFDPSKGVSVEVLTKKEIKAIPRNEALRARQNGVKAMFNEARSAAQSLKTLDQAVFLSRMLKINPFGDFRHEDNIYELIEIFSNVIQEAQKLNPAEVLKSQFYRNVFCALTKVRKQLPKSRRGIDPLEWYEGPHLYQILGTDNKDVLANANNWMMKICNDYIDILKNAKTDSSQFSVEEQEKSKSEFAAFLKDCQRIEHLDVLQVKGYLEQVEKV